MQRNLGREDADQIREMVRTRMNVGCCQLWDVVVRHGEAFRDVHFHWFMEQADTLPT